VTDDVIASHTDLIVAMLLGANTTPRHQPQERI